jgi:succinate-semialdehyde dehydrogenase/glutarate-semialdehyde dehydrogenase
VAALSVQVKFRNAGQVCVSPSRFFVHESRLDAFTERFVAETKKLKVGDPLADDTDVGPLGSRKRLAAIEALVEETRAAGGTVRIGGHRSAGFNKGFFYDPTVITGVTDDMRLMREEIFGPVVPIASFRSVDEVMARANATEYGLSSYLFTRDLTRAHAMSAGLRAGMVGVNTFALAAAEVPFGGIRDSGFGREGGSQGIRDYLETKYTHMVI